MLFQTTQFLGFFLIFYSLFLLLHNRTQARLLVLLGASYIFYSYWDWRFLGLIIFSTGADYYLGKWIEDCADQARKKRLLIASVVLNLSVLGFFKYFNFFLDGFHELLTSFGVSSPSPIFRIILPVGISFYTFESLSYVIDVYRGKLKATRSFLDYAIFISFFPHLVAGPIIRPKTFFQQIRTDLNISEKEFHLGMIRFGVGVLKKVFLADILALHFADLVFESPDKYSALDCLLAAYAYAFQIYLDFSAYSDMAIGLSQACGIHLPENFNYPYVARNLQDFWNRWHISLSTWLRDYLYIPLGGNRDGNLKKHRNIMLTMVLGGLWHGANMTFIVWGFIHGIFISASHLIKDRIQVPAKSANILGWFLTFHIVVLAWVYFRAPNLHDAHAFLSRVFLLPLQAPKSVIPWECVLVLLICAVTQYFGARGSKFRWIENFSTRPWWQLIFFYVLIVGSIILAEQHFQPFIYFQF